MFQRSTGKNSGVEEESHIYRKNCSVSKLIKSVFSLICLFGILQGRSEDLPSGVNCLDDFIKISHIKPLEGFQPLEDQAEKTIALILCSSGTTGLPKGVALSHLCLTASIVQFKIRIGSPEDEQFHMGLMPFFHSFGNMVTTRNLLSTKTVISFKRFDEDIYLKTIQDYKMTILGIAPPIALLLAKSPKVIKYNLDSVTSIVCGAAPMSKTVEEEVRKR